MKMPKLYFALKLNKNEHYVSKTASEAECLDNKS